LIVAVIDVNERPQIWVGGIGRAGNAKSSEIAEDDSFSGSGATGSVVYRSQGVADIFTGAISLAKKHASSQLRFQSPRTAENSTIVDEVDLPRAGKIRRNQFCALFSENNHFHRAQPLKRFEKYVCPLTGTGKRADGPKGSNQVQIVLLTAHLFFPIMN
jgi:hypothetical protein